MASEIKVRFKKSPDRSYSITVHGGILRDLPRVIARRWKHSKIFIITDSIVRKRYGNDLQGRLIGARIDSQLFSFPSGEKSKNAPIVEKLQTSLLRNTVRRNSVVVALGGGVTGDVAGFVAATILRGVEYIQVPTSLLAQVDSSVGGKVGIDHPSGKNLIGAFHQPAGVYIDPLVLKTLPEREFRNGLAEVVKIAAALDKDYFEFLERNAGSLTRTAGNLLSQIIVRSVQLKSAIVENDEFESGIRKALNLGHTIGHALESASGFRLKHGEAVAMGIVVESRIAVHLGFLQEGEYLRVVHLLKQLQLPVRPPAIRNRVKFFSSLAADKKNDQGLAKFVLLNGIGRSVIGVPVSAKLIEYCLHETSSMWRR